MAAVFAATACLLIQLSALIIPNAFSHRRYRKIAFSIFTAVVAGAIFYVSISKLTDSNRYPWYWIVAFPVGIFFSNIFVALFVFNPKHKGK